MVLLAALSLAASIDRAIPAVLSNGYEQTVILEGTEFVPGMRVRFPLRTPTGNVVKELPAKVLSSTTLQVSIPAYQLAGKHDVELIWPSGESRCLQGGLDIQFDNCSLEPVYFEFNRFDLTEAAREAVDHNARCLLSGDVFQGRLLGFADERGELPTNRDLSSDRARSVESRLRTKMGTEGPRLDLEVYALGEQLPASEGHDESAWARNRRVELGGLRSLSEPNARCPTIEAHFPAGSATLDAGALSRIDHDWECYLALGVDSVVVYGSPDADSTSPSVHPTGEGTVAPSEEELSGWALGKARAEALVGRLDSRLAVETVVWIPDHDDPRSSRRYGTASLMELYRPESPRPKPERAPIGSCPLEFASRDTTTAVAPAPPATPPRIHFVDRPQIEQPRPWLLGGGVSAGMGVDSALEGQWGSQATAWIRMGRGLHVDAFATTSLAKANADGGVRLGVFLDPKARSALWTGYAAGSNRIGLGAETVVATGFSDRLVLGVVGDAWLGLRAKDGWRASLALSAAWQELLTIKGVP